MDAAATASRTEGTARLLEHCEALGRLTAREPASARTRLEAVLGCELAGRLLGALTRPHTGVAV